jgi:hypothetical protein
MICKFNEFLNENVGFKFNNEKPKIFQYTIYRLPEKEEIYNIDKFNLSAKEILDGFGYTIIGRGIASKSNYDAIFKSIQMMIDEFPDNENYKEALQLAENEWIKIKNRIIERQNKK